jgi:O-antigen ligase
VAPLKALPVLARDLVYLGAFLGARAWLGSARGANIVLIAAAVGLLVPAMSGLVQWMTGGGLVAAGSWRLSGLYGSSPVGLALAMQLGVVFLAGSSLTEGFAPRLRWVAGILALALMSVILVQTSSRLPFLTTVVALMAFEVARRRWVGAAVVLVLSALLMLSSGGLSARIGSTFVPTATSAPTVSTAPVPSGGMPAATPATDANSGDEDVGGGAASLRYRLFVWRTMMNEWWASPLVGRGTGTFATLLEQRTGLHRVAPHNDYVYALVEGGALLFLLYVGLQAMVVIGLLAGALRDANARLPLVALVAFGMTNIANSINNAVFYLDLQLVVWVIAASVLASTEHRVGVPAHLWRPEPGTRTSERGS